jgi:hypothetical protein
VEDGVVGEAEDLEVVGGEVGVAFAVVLDLLVVDGAVEFDDEFGGGAVEVEDVGAEWLLAAEAEVVQTPGP